RRQAEQALLHAVGRRQAGVQAARLRVGGARFVPARTSEGTGVAMKVELVDRYLQAVRMLLPRKQRNDVDRELAEEIHSQIEAKEAALGRAPSQDEVFAILKSFGHPALLALRYQEGRALIGPRVFPLYWFSVKAILAILAVVHIVLPAVFAVAMGESAAKF